jgi:hypothetical protein
MSPRLSPGGVAYSAEGGVETLCLETHQDRFLEAQREAREATLPDIAHDEVCMLLSRHNVNFSWWAGDHDAGEDRVP